MMMVPLCRKHVTYSFFIFRFPPHPVKQNNGGSGARTSEQRDGQRKAGVGKAWEPCKWQVIFLKKSTPDEKE